MNCTPAAMAAGSPAARATSSSVWIFFSPSGSKSIISSIVTKWETGATSAPAAISVMLLPSVRPVTGHPGHPSARQQPAPLVRGRQVHDDEQPPPLLELAPSFPRHCNPSPHDRQVHDLQALPGVHRLGDVEPLLR